MGVNAQGVTLTNLRSYLESVDQLMTDSYPTIDRLFGTRSEPPLTALPTEGLSVSAVCTAAAAVEALVIDAAVKGTPAVCGSRETLVVSGGKGAVEVEMKAAGSTEGSSDNSDNSDK